MNKIKAIIFDMDGVVYDTEKVYLDGWIKVFKEYGYDMKKENYISVMGTGRKNVKEVFLKIYGDKLPIEEMYKKKDEELFRVIKDEGIPLKENIIELLDILKERGIKIALGTSAKRERLEKQLKDDVRKRFDTVVCGDDVEKSKPNPDIFLKAAEKLSVEPESCIVIEDSTSGIIASYNAGMMGIHVEDLKPADGEILKHSYKNFKNLNEVKGYILKTIK